MADGFTLVDTAVLFRVIAVDPEATAADGVIRPSLEVADDF